MRSRLEGPQPTPSDALPRTSNDRPPLRRHDFEIDLGTDSYELD